MSQKSNESLQRTFGSRALWSSWNASRRLPNAAEFERSASKPTHSQEMKLKARSNRGPRHGRSLFAKPIFLAVILGLFAAAAPTFAGEAVFDALAVTVDGTKYTFSRAPATTKEPVVIKAEGRKLTAADRKHRIDLQKAWISKNVPKAYVFRLRSLQECEFKGDDDFNACDVYSFEDPKTGQQRSYYIYVGNWPME